MPITRNGQFVTYNGMVANDPELCDCSCGDKPPAQDCFCIDESYMTAGGLWVHVTDKTGGCTCIVEDHLAISAEYIYPEDKDAGWMANGDSANTPCYWGINLRCSRIGFGPNYKFEADISGCELNNIDPDPGYTCDPPFFRFSNVSLSRQHPPDLADCCDGTATFTVDGVAP